MDFNGQAHYYLQPDLWCYTFHTHTLIVILNLFTQISSIHLILKKYKGGRRMLSLKMYTSTYQRWYYCGCLL